ncbi:HAMP domain-containing sensor histidine kinase [Mycobacterium asiaticum]|uniref:HAMP domain-containing sensor histidine kinase n=1 Tax=Mycobacterium asiaticum TaxID=1790 RepID=UPI000A5B09A0|nr:HAMP domain-containing sensor histidine kinase [Mycobacterium asiaticum]
MTSTNTPPAAPPPAVRRHSTGVVIGAGLAGLALGAAAAFAVTGLVFTVRVQLPPPPYPQFSSTPSYPPPPPVSSVAPAPSIGTSVPPSLVPVPPPPLPPGPPLLPPPPPPPAVPPDGTATVLVHPLPGGARVILVADTTQTTEVTRDLRRLMISGGLATLVVAGLLLVAVSRTALRPLDRLTSLARDITTGDRGGRLRPSRTDTELGRAASAFDGMLDALEESEQRARRAAEEAQRAEAATRQFLVDAAHELRTPIAGMQAAAEQLAAHETDSAGQQRRADLLRSDARRAGRLVADMLDLSRIDAGLALDCQDTDLAVIVDAEVQRASMLSPRISVVRTGLPMLTIHADPMRVAQSLSNLLDNARRYTPAGSITVDLSEDGAAAVITVTDTGPGVPDDQRDRIFERLVRLDAGRAREHGGAGLGLPIARALARAHGGDLICVPHDGGAQFRLSLPLSSSRR